jgi:putative FmdB family regulatory protein
MPIFDYHCQACGFEFEELVTRPSEVMACVRCGKPAKKLLSAFASPSGGSSAASDACACHPSGGGCGGSFGSH